MDGTLTFHVDLSMVDVSVAGVRQTGMATMTMPVSAAMAVALLGGVAMQPEAVTVPAVEIVAVAKAADPLPEEILPPEPLPVPKIGMPAQAFFESIMGEHRPPFEPASVVLPDPVEAPVIVSEAVVEKPAAPVHTSNLRGSKPAIDLPEDELIALLSRPIPVSQLAVELGVSGPTVYKYLSKYSIDVERKNLPRGISKPPMLDAFEDDFLRAAFTEAGSQEAAGARFGCSTKPIAKKLKELGMRLPVKPPVARVSKSPLADMPDDELRDRILAAGSVLGAVKDLKTSGNAVLSAMHRLDLHFPDKEVELDRSKTFRHRTEGSVLCYGPDPDYSDDEIIEAFGECNEDGEMATGMGRPHSWIEAQRHRLRIHTVTGKVRKDDPAEAAKDMEEYLTRWAISSGTWHLDADGNVLRYADPSIPLPVCVPRPLPVIEEAAPTAGEIVEASTLKPTPRQRLRVPTTTTAKFGRPPTIRKMMSPISQAETDRLVAEAMATGRFQKIEPGAAIGAKLSSERY